MSFAVRSLVGTARVCVHLCSYFYELSQLDASFTLLSNGYLSVL